MSEERIGGHTPVVTADGAEPTVPPSYYAKEMTVWKSPVKTARPDGGMSISLGFPVCIMHEAANDQADTLAKMLNRSEVADDLLAFVKDIAEHDLVFAKGAEKDRIKAARALVAKAEGATP